MKVHLDERIISERMLVPGGLLEAYCRNDSMQIFYTARDATFLLTLCKDSSGISCYADPCAIAAVRSVHMHLARFRPARQYLPSLQLLMMDGYSA